MKKLLVTALILLAPLAPLGAEAFFFSPGGGSGGSISAVGTTDNQALL